MKQVSVIYLIRHGECTDNAAGVLNGLNDSELTEKGREQARNLAIRLGELALPAAVYTSRLLRARQTADIVAAGLQGVPIPIVRPELRERDLGRVTGMTAKQALETIPEPDRFISKMGVPYCELAKHGFETFDETTLRLKRFLGFLATHYDDDKSIWAFTHGDAGAAAIAAHTGRPMREIVDEIYFTNTDIVRLDPDGYEKLPQSLGVVQ